MRYLRHNGIGNILLFLILLLSESCSKDKPASFPEGYTDFYNSFLNHDRFKTATLRNNIFSIVFSDGSTIFLYTNDILVEDSRFVPAGKVSVRSDGIYIIGETVTGVQKDESLTDEVSLPVYISFNDRTITLLLQNGHTHSISTTKQIPVIYLRTKNNSKITSKEEYIEGTISITDRTGLYPEMDGFTAEMKIRGRGNSTWNMPKKPWKIKLAEKTRMFGMSKDKEWCLLANYSDKTLMRNMVAMQLSKMCRFSWTPAMISVDIYLNDIYQGVYTFSEHKKVSSERVNINTDQGDFYFEIEQFQDNPVSWNTSIYKIPLMFDDPEEPGKDAIAEGKKVFSDFEQALSAESFADPDKGYAAHIDVESFINNYIVQELTKNIDGDLRKSTFLTKTVGGKLEMYHIWDFDLALGNCDYFASEVGMPISNGYSGWYVRDFSHAGYQTGWYYRLFQDPAFVGKVIDKWNRLYPLFKTGIPEFIESQYSMMEASADDNFVTWDILSSYVWPNVVVTGSYRSEVNYLKYFFLQRLEWMNSEFSNM